MISPRFSDAITVPSSASEIAGRFNAAQYRDGDPVTEFWESDPMEIWDNKVVEAVQMLEQSTDVVMLSGRHGIGKSYQFSNNVHRALEPNIESFDVEMIDSRAYDHATNDKPFLILDEMSAPVLSQPEETKSFLGTLLGQKQLVMIFPGPTVDIRRKVTEQAKDMITALKPDATIADLGDVAKVYLDTVKSVGLLARLGAEADALDMVSAAPALRNPHVFRALIRRARDLDKALTAEDILLDIRISSYSVGREVLRAIDSEMGQYYALSRIQASLVKSRERHALFISQTVPTEDAVALYGLAGLELPEFTPEIIEELGFDPYKKS